MSVGLKDNKPVEVFFNSLNPDHVQWSTGLMLTMSSVMRNGGIDKHLKRLRGVHGPKGGHYRPKTGLYFPSVVAEIAEIIQSCYSTDGVGDEEDVATTLEPGDREPVPMPCPSCYSPLTKVDGCAKCHVCDYNACG